MQTRSPHVFSLRFGDERRRCVKPFWFSRRQHHQRFAMFSLRHSKRNQRQRLFGNSKSYFKFPPTFTFSGGAPNAITRFASFLLCIQKPLACANASLRNGRK